MGQHTPAFSGGITLQPSGCGVSGGLRGSPMENRWSDEEAAGLSELELLVYQSRLIGAEPSLVLWGGGNLSLKVTERDFRGREVRVLRVKSSGSDMKSIQTVDFPGVRMEDVLPLFERADVSDEEMVDYLAKCLLDPGSSRPSIETLLHAFLPHTSVIHSHADAILSLTNTQHSQKVIKEVYGESIVVVPYHRPGFLLSKEVAQTSLKNPRAKGAILSNHGLLTWGSGAQASYETHIELVSQAEGFIRQRSGDRIMFGGVRRTALEPEERQRVAAAVAPTLRRLVDSGTARGRVVLRFDDSPDILEFIGSKKAQELTEAGAAAPDHLLHTKRTPLLVDTPDPAHTGNLRQALEEGVARYVQAYTDWFCRHAPADQEMLDSYPRVVVVPGLGMWTIGRDVRATTIAADIYHHTIAIMAGAQGVDEYVSLSLKDAYKAEYWPQQLYKLSLLPPEKELSLRIALVTGAAHGIGQAIARRFAAEGAHLVLTDVDLEGVLALAYQLNDEYGAERCTAVRLDVTSEQETSTAFRHAALTYGGLDILVSNAGIAPAGALDQLALADWERSLSVNATGHFLVAREAVRMMREQGFGGSMVFIATKNVMAPGRGFGAYSAAKSAEVQLARVLAMENGGHGIRCNIVNPDAVFQDSGLWSQELRKERAEAHGVPVSELEEFYRKRNLLQAYVTPYDVAQAALYLASDRSAKTTGCIITVDGGVPEAFPR